MLTDFKTFLAESKVEETHKPGHMVQLISENAQVYEDDHDDGHTRENYLGEVKEGVDKLIKEGLLPGKSCTPPKMGQPGTCTHG